MAELKQSTARVRVFKMIDSQDHFTKKTGLTCTVNLSKNGGAFGAAGGSVAEIANGWYSVSLNTTDTNTLGDLAYYITATGADDTDFSDQVTTQILGDTITANTTQLAGQTVTAGAGVTFPASVASPTNITAGTITTTTNLTNLPAITANWLTAAGTATDFGAELATAIWTDTTAGDFTTALSIGKSVMNGVSLGTGLTINGYTGNTVQTGDSFARIGVAGAGLTNIDLPNQTMDITGNITGNLSGSVGSVTGAVGSVTGAVGSVTGAVGSVTGNVGGNVVGSVASVTAGVTVTTNNDKTGYGLSSAAVQAIWDALTSALTTVGSIGKLIVTNLDALISSRMATYTQPTGFLAATFPAGTVANTTNITAGTITTVTNLTNAPTVGDLTATMKTSVTTAATASTPVAASVTGAVGSVTAAVAITAAAVDLIWDEATAGHTTAGTTGKALIDAGSAGDPWSTALPGAYGAGTAGKIVGDNINATVSSRATQTSVDTVDDLLDTEIASIKSDTASILIDTAEIGIAGAGLTNINLPNQTMDIVGNITGNLSGSVGSVTGAVASVTGLTASDVAAIKAKTDSLTYTVANQVDANIQSVNDVTVNGNGAGTPWGP